MPGTLYLASRSPRRRELLKQIGVKFEALLLRLANPRGPDIDESQGADESCSVYVERTAREKAAFGLNVLRMRSMQYRPVLAADTIVIVDGVVLPKPADADQAREFMMKLSGRTHEVRTAVALAMEGSLTAAISVSQVTFRTLEESEITRYCGTPEPYDKAGGYAIQGLAAVFIERLEGSYSGVMGLPLYETGQLLSLGGMKVV